MAMVPRLSNGGTVACLATGPSLTKADVDYVRGKAIVVAINDAHRLAPWADVLYSSDRRWWNHYKGVPEFQGLRFGIGSGIGKKNPAGSKWTGVKILRNTGYHGLEKEPDALRNGRNSGYAAINLAVHLGARRILLLGYNMSYLKNRAHFFGSHPPGLPQSASLYPGFRKNFEHMVKPLAELGVEVINCTPDTSLMCFPIKPLREVLKETAVAA